MQLICGINPVLEALSARERHFDRLLVVKGLRNRRVSEAIARASKLGIPLRFEPRDTLDRIAGGVPHQGVIAVVSAKPLLTLETLLDQARSPALFVVLDGIEDPRNLGAIIRTAEAAGADGVLLPDRRSAGLSDTVARASAGALEHAKIAQIGNVAHALDKLKAHGVWVVGFDAGGSERWDAVDLRGPAALVLGGEGRGMRRIVRERCDHLASLPVFGHVESLNVSVAAGIALYEAIRQRGAMPSHVRPIPPRATAAPAVVIGPAPNDPETDPGRAREEPAAALEQPRDDTDEVRHGPTVLVEDEDTAWWGAQQTAEDVQPRPLPGRARPPAAARSGVAPSRAHGRGRDHHAGLHAGQGGLPGGAPIRGRRHRRHRRPQAPRPERAGAPQQSPDPPSEPASVPPESAGSEPLARSARSAGPPEHALETQGLRRRRRRRRRR
jgi:23S rRNA (guanosine2251-2'-O)-methyltransferase